MKWFSKPRPPWFLLFLFGVIFIFFFGGLLWIISLGTFELEQALDTWIWKVVGWDLRHEANRRKF